MGALPITEAIPNKVIVQAVRSIGDPGPGGSTNSLNIVEIPFAYNTPGILTGVSVYDPTAGDVLVDWWVEVDTAWNGITPQLDLGTFSSFPGMLADLGVPPIGLTTIDQDLGGFSANPGLLAAGGLSSFSAALINFAIANATPVRRWSLKFTATNSLKIVVSQDGSNRSSPAAATLVATTAPSLPIVISPSLIAFSYLGTDPVGGGGGVAPETFTFGFGTFSTLSTLATAMGAATGTTHAHFSDVCTVGNNGTELTLTMVATGAAANGNQIQPATQDISTALGFLTPSIFSGGTGGNPGSTQGSAKLVLLVGTPS